MSLDGFIAGPQGNYDWIVMDKAIYFAALFREFDTAVMGRKTYEATMAGGAGSMQGLDVVVFSRTLPAMERKGLRITSDDPGDVVRAMKARPGRDIWLFGGGVLFRTLLDAGLVDSVEVAVMPVLLGEGIPLLPPGGSTTLVLSDQKTLRGSGIVLLAYSLPGSAGPSSRIRYIGTARKGGAKKARGHQDQ